MIYVIKGSYEKKVHVLYLSLENKKHHFSVDEMEPADKVGTERASAIFGA
jgi:hypothetical protein